MNENAIEIRGLEKSFEKFKLGPMDLTVPRGAIYGFIGPNAAGKTTTIDLMFGMGNADAGTIRILGLDHQAEDVEMKRRIGYVSPDLSFAVWTNIKKAIQFVRGFYPTWDDDYCVHLLNSLKLSLDDKIATLSFGARTKLSLLLALSHRPEVLVLDEPTTGLDAVSKQQVFAELLAAVKDGDRTVLISSHGLADLERFTDHIGLIKEGKLLLEGRTDDVVERHRMVDFEAPPQVAFTDSEGFTVVEHQANRWRALLDQTLGGLERIKSSGVQQLTTSPVTLEDLFVALVKDKEVA